MKRITTLFIIVLLSGISPLSADPETELKTNKKTFLAYIKEGYVIVSAHGLLYTLQSGKNVAICELIVDMDGFYTKYCADSIH
jgi:hypothetical protein